MKGALMRARPLWTTVMTVVVAGVLTAGCDAGEGPQVATADGSPAAPGAGTSVSSAAASGGPAAESDYDKALRYTRCMTDKGVVTPDPVEGQRLVTYNILRSGPDPGAKVQAAYDAHQKCKQFLPANWPIKVDPKEVARSREYRVCMRENGIAQPEPDANGMVQEPTDMSWLTTPEYEAALAKCRHLVDDPANDLPENR
jgi:hypothetical protein